MTSTRPETPLCDNATELIRQLKRNSDMIPPFNSELYKECIGQINHMYTLSFNQLNEVRAGRFDSTQSQKISQEATARGRLIQYAQRCCTGYIQERMNRIKALRWKFGGALPPAIKTNLHESEIDFYNEYCNSLAEFQRGFCESEGGISLMTNVHPPKSLFIQVRAMEDYGEFETSDGTVVILQKNSLHSLPHQDCEMLIRQGILEIAH